MFPKTATEVVVSLSLFNRTSVPLGEPLTNPSLMRWIKDLVYLIPSDKVFSLKQSLLLVLYLLQPH